MQISNKVMKVQTITIQLDNDEERNALAGLMMNAVAWHCSGVLGRLCNDLYNAIQEGGATSAEWKPLVRYTSNDNRSWAKPPA